MPGWSAELDRDTAAGTTRSVTWTAPPNGRIVGSVCAVPGVAVTLPDTDTVTFPATHTYSDGTVVRWDQSPLPGGGEPGHPVPTLTLTAAPPEGAGQNPSPAVSASRTRLGAAARRTMRVSQSCRGFRGILDAGRESVPHLRRRPTPSRGPQRQVQRADPRRVPGTARRATAPPRQGRQGVLGDCSAPSSARALPAYPEEFSGAVRNVERRGRRRAPGLLQSIFECSEVCL